MQGILKRSLALAAGVVIVRLVLEEVGAPSWMTNVFGVTWLYALVPFYFAMKVADSADTRPYLALAKISAGFVLAAAAMVGATYSMAYRLRFSATRFTAAGGGVVGEGITPVQGYIVTPAINFGLATSIGLIVAFVIGPAVLWALRRSRRQA